jgi:hypothetical protein
VLTMNLAVTFLTVRINGRTSLITHDISNW